MGAKFLIMYTAHPGLSALLLELQPYPRVSQAGTPFAW